MASSSACVSDSVRWMAQQVGHGALGDGVAQHGAQAVAELGAVLDARLDVDHLGGLVLAGGGVRDHVGHARQPAEQLVDVGRFHAHFEHRVAGLLRRFAQQRGRQQLALQRAAQVTHLAPGIGELLRRHLDVQLLAHGQEALQRGVLRLAWFGRCRVRRPRAALLLHGHAAGKARRGLQGRRRGAGSESVAISLFLRSQPPSDKAAASASRTMPERWRAERKRGKAEGARLVMNVP
jgi:hypothetical protein